MNALLPQNEGTLDRVVRVIAGFALLSLLVVFPEASWRWAGLIGLVPIVTGAVGSCPIYTMLGLSTKGADAHAK